MKTNKQLNQEHEARQQDRVRPKGPDYDFKSIEAVIRQWVEASKTA